MEGRNCSFGMADAGGEIAHTINTKRYPAGFERVETLAHRRVVNRALPYWSRPAQKRYSFREVGFAPERPPLVRAKRSFFQMEGPEEVAQGIPHLQPWHDEVDETLLFQKFRGLKTRR